MEPARPAQERAGCESRPFQCTDGQTPRTLGAERQAEAFRGFTPAQSRVPEPGAKSSPGANPIADAILGAAVTRRPGTNGVPGGPPRGSVRQPLPSPVVKHRKRGPT